MFGYFLQLQHTWKTHVVWTGLHSTLEVLIKYFLKCNSQACNIPQPYTMSTCLPVEVRVCAENPIAIKLSAPPQTSTILPSPDPGLNPDHHWDPLCIPEKEDSRQGQLSLSSFFSSSNGFVIREPKHQVASRIQC